MNHFLRRTALVLLWTCPSLIYCLVSNSLFDLTVNDHDGGICEGECELSMSCWMGGGVVEPAGNCHSIFQVIHFYLFGLLVH